VQVNLKLPLRDIWISLATFQNRSKPFSRSRPRTTRVVWRLLLPFDEKNDLMADQKSEPSRTHYSGNGSSPCCLPSRCQATDARAAAASPFISLARALIGRGAEPPALRAARGRF